jgi:hypothetical protein
MDYFKHNNCHLVAVVALDREACLEAEAGGAFQQVRVQPLSWSDVTGMVSTCVE